GAAIADAMGRTKAAWRDRFLWLSSPAANRLILGSGAVLVMALSVVLTMSRSGIGALVLALGLIAGVAIRRQPLRSRIIAVAYVVALLAIVTAWVGADRIVDRFAAANWYELNDRRGPWSDAWAVISRYPLTGSGLNTY